MSDATHRWRKVTREHPCPKCGNVNRCTIAPDGYAGVCWRSDSSKSWHDPKPINGNGQYHRPKQTRKSTARSFATREAAIEASLRSVRRDHVDAELTRVFEYHAIGGALLFCVARFDWPGDKTFRPVHLHKSEWCEGDPLGKLPLYRVNEIPKAGPIYVCEGEKAADAAISIGLSATTSAHGAASAEKTDWTPLAEHDGEIIILPDNDEPGAKYARAVARLIFKQNPSARIKIVNLPGLPDGGDIVEYIDAAGTREEIESLAKAATLIDASSIIGGPVLTCMADVEAVAVQWLWPGRIPLGRITLLVGRPGEGKSFLATYIAATVANGGPWPDGCGNTPRGSVLFISAEDDPGDTIRPRLDAHHADVSRVHILVTVRRMDEDGKASEVMFTLADVHALREAVKRIPDLRFIIIDPIGSFLGGSTDAHRDNEVRGILAPVAQIARECGAAVLIVAHRRKSSGDNADDLALGSRAFTGIARAVWHLNRDPQNKARRLLLAGKNNLAPEGTGLAFTIAGDPPSLQWERDAVDMSANDALAVENGDDDGKPGPEPEVRNMAADWLRAELADLHEHPVSVLREAADAAGVGSYKTLQRAAQEIGVIVHRASFGGGYIWRLPKPATLLDTMQDSATKNERTCPPVQQGESFGKTADSAGQVPLLDKLFSPVQQGAETATEDEYDRLERAAIQERGM